MSIQDPSRCMRITALGASVLGLALLGAPAPAVTIVSPGESIVLDAADDLTCEELADGPESGDGIAITASCATGVLGEASERHLDVVVFSGFTTYDLPFGQTASATARLIHEVSIPTTSPGSEVLAAQVSTEVSWSGALIVGGVNSTFAQVVATFQIRDLTTGLIVASDTFLNERADADLSLDVIDAVDGVDITSSTGTEINALLVRGRTYAIEVEAKCDMAVPLLGGAVCTFFNEVVGIPGIVTLFEGDGFDIGEITVTVASDPIAELLD